MRTHFSREIQRRDRRPPQLKKLLAKITEGDVLIISAVDRLSRDTTDLLIIARQLQEVGAGLRSIAEPVLDTTSDFAEVVLAILGVAAKLERRRIKERTRSSSNSPTSARPPFTMGTSTASRAATTRTTAAPSTGRRRIPAIRPWR